MGFYDAIRVGASGAGEDYEVERSLRINKPDDPQLYRTGSNNASTYTISMWVKISGSFSNYRRLFSSYADGLILNNDGRLRYEDEGDGQAYSTAVFRDPSAWYHIVMAVTPSGGTVYVNNVSHITSSMTHSLSTASNALRHFWNPGDPGEFAFDGYGAEVALIDGQALTPSSFAETNATTGQWIPKDLSGLTFGSNGHYLKFTDTSNLGKDFSGNDNHFTTANFSVSAGAGNDSLEDSPTNNFCTLSPLLTDTRSDSNFSQGNLTVTTGSGASTVGTTFPQTTGKWYAEFVCTAKSSVNMLITVNSVEGFDGERQGNESQNGGVGYSYVNNGNRGDGSSYGASWAIDDVMGIALNLDDNQVTFYKNNSSQGAISISDGYNYVMACGHGQGGVTATFDVNFGQRAFSYTPPTGYKK